MRPSTILGFVVLVAASSMGCASELAESSTDGAAAQSVAAPRASLAGEYLAEGRSLVVTRSAPDHIAYEIDVGETILKGEADATPRGFLHAGTTGCTLLFSTPRAGALRVSATGCEEELDPIGLGNIDGVYTRDVGVPVVATYHGGQGELTVNLAQGARIDFAIDVTDAEGKAGSIEGRAARSGTNAFYTFTERGCTMNLHFGRRSALVEVVSGCTSRSNGLALGGRYALLQ